MFDPDANAVTFVARLEGRALAREWYIKSRPEPERSRLQEIDRSDRLGPIECGLVLIIGSVLLCGFYLLAIGGPILAIHAICGC
jgi:hypothetical protein